MTISENMSIIDSSTHDSIIEPLLTPSDDRFVMFPVQDEEIWKMYKKSTDCFWRVDEVDLSKDGRDWESLTCNEQLYISRVLAFFSSSDGIVLENLATRFMNDVQLSEARAFYGFQIGMETIHSEMYSVLIETYIKNAEEKATLFNAVQEFPCIGKKADWAQKWINNDSDSFAMRLIGFACVEGIFFSGAFCSIYWLKQRGLMPGLTFSNELISRDEALHTEFAVHLYNKLINKLPVRVLQNIIKEAVDLEIEFICESLPCSLIGMNSSLMSTYIKFVADRLLAQLNCPKVYSVQNPFAFMELISLDGKTNFFEKRVGEYALANKDFSDDVFNMTESF